MKRPRIPPLRAKGVDPGDMYGEKIAEGLTLGPDAKEEADEKFPALPGAPDLSYLTKPGGVKFRAFDRPQDPFYIGFPDGRLMRDVDVAFSADDRAKIEHGYICLRCLEPQSAMNADEHLPGCIGVAHYGERYMRDGYHTVDVAAEFDEQLIHAGPARPLRAYLEEMEQEQEQRRFRRKLNGG